MTGDNPRQEDATTADLSRHVATSDDIEYSLTVEEALARYETAGIPRTPRSVQRYCAPGGHLKAHRLETEFGEKFLITPESVDAHIAYIKEVRQAATSRDMSRHVATEGAVEIEPKSHVEESANGGDKERQAATAPDLSSPVAADPSVVDLLKSENAFLRGQIAVKDKQIEALNERVFETNSLTANLQQMLTPLIGRSGKEERVHTYREGDNDETT